MENEIIKVVKEKLLNSPIVKYVSEEEIDNALSKIYICKSEEEVNKKYYEINEAKYPGVLRAFNNNGTSYVYNDGNTHQIIHEILHTFSSEFENGHRIISGIEGDKGATNYGDRVNEGLTDYLASKISSEACDMYKHQKLLFEEIDESIAKFYEDEDILFDIYLNKEPERLKYFIDTCYKEGTFDHLYEKYDILDKSKIFEISKNINKGAQKILKEREFFCKHPFLAKMVNKFSKNNITNVPVLPKTAKEYVVEEKLSNELKEQLNSVEDINIEEKNKDITDRCISKEENIAIE